MSTLDHLLCCYAEEACSDAEVATTGWDQIGKKKKNWPQKKICSPPVTLAAPSLFSTSCHLQYTGPWLVILINYLHCILILEGTFITSSNCL